ncbi:MAG: hypothetical protein ABTA23_07945 [Solibacillus sp.]
MTNYNHVANYCMDNPEHPMFRATDGALCVKCRGMVNVKPVTKAQYNKLPTYQQLCNERKRPYQFKAQCLVCDHEGMVFHNSKEDYQEVNVCPKCKGAFVDTWKLAKYKRDERKGQSIRLGVDKDTDKLQLKLRAIAKHAEALANELNAIDSFDDELPTYLEGSD